MAKVAADEGLARVDQWADRITTALNSTVEGIFATASELAKAKAALKHGEWSRLFEPDEHGVRKVPLSINAAQRFMSIRRNHLLVDAKAAHAQLLPPSWTTLAALAALPDDTLKAAITDGKVHPEMERKDVAAIKRAYAPPVDDDGALIPTPTHPTWSRLKPDAYREKSAAAESATRDALERAWAKWPEDAFHADVFTNIVTLFLHGGRQTTKGAAA